MNRTELVDRVADDTETSKAQTARVIERALTVIQRAMIRGDDVHLNGFGSFSVTVRAASDGRHPNTGEKIKIAAKRVAKFKPAVALRNALNP